MKKKTNPDSIRTLLNIRNTLYIKHIYLMQKKLFGVELSLDEYEFVIYKTFEKIFQEILNFRVYDMPYFAGKLHILRKECALNTDVNNKPTLERSSYLVDFRKTNELGYKVYHMDIPFKYYIRWRKGRSIRSRSFYVFLSENHIRRKLYDKNLKDAII